MMFDFKLLKRVRQVVGVLTKYELDYLIDILDLRSHLPFFKRWSRSANFSYEKLTQPKVLKNIFEDLGGGFLKLGQLLALRPDLVGEKYSREFDDFFSHINPVDFDTIKDLTKDIPLKNLSKKPLGSGSIAQVHKATLNGKSVAIKIKRPGVDEIFSQDIKLLEFFAKKINAHFHPEVIDVIAIVEEFKNYTKQELDLSHEVANMKRFQKHLQHEKHILIPKVHDAYCTKDILVMDFMQGIPINTITKNKKFIVSTFVGVVYKMLFEDRFFHADLHPGNVLVNNKDIILLDFGIAGHIDREFEKKLFFLFSSLIQGNLDKLADSLLDIDIGDDEPDVQVLKDGLFNVLADYYSESLSKLPFDKVFYGALDVARRSKLKLPSNMVLFGKSLISLDGTCREIDSSFNVVNHAKPYVRKILLRKYSPKSFFKDSKKIIFQFYELFSGLPSGVKSFSRKFSKIEERVIDMDKTFHGLNNTFRQMMKLLSMTILFATFFTSSIMLRHSSPLVAGFSIFFYVGIILSLFLAVGVIDLLLKK